MSCSKMTISTDKCDTEILSGGARCCSLHVAVTCGDDMSSGCAKWKYGFHRSISSLYRHGSVVCYAEEGALVIDSRVALIMKGIDPFGKFFPRKGFISKYCKGSPISVSAYGAGYCYLLPIRPDARSRVARILGPLPLLVDAIRAWIMFGSSGVAISFERISEFSYHVEPGTDANYIEAARAFVSYLGDSVRVGANEGDLNEILKDKAKFMKNLEALDTMSSDPLSVDHVYSAGCFAPFGSIVHGFVDYDGLKRIHGERVDKLKLWFQSVGYDPSVKAMNQLLVATCAPGVMANKHVELKDSLQTWAILGDAVIRLLMASFVVSKNGSPSYYNTINQSANNVSMASALAKSGLRAHCNVGLLSVTSKANATILEAVVGVVANHACVDDLLCVVRAFGYVCDSSEAAMSGDVVVEQGAVLNSRQHVIVMRLLHAGLLN